MYNLVELFSGIGSQAKAMKNLNMKPNVVGVCEWDIHAFVAYDAIHNSPRILKKYEKMTKEDLLKKLNDKPLSNNGKSLMSKKTLNSYSDQSLRRICAAIDRCNNYVDVSTLKGANMCNNIDILTYSFPCQDLSNVGAFHGYNKGIDKGSGSRSSLLWQVGRILTEMKDSNINLPRFLLMENVPSLLAERHKKNFDEWINDLSELGYISKYYQLNAKDFGLPQNRPRLLMLSVYVGENKGLQNIVNNYFETKSSEDIVNDYMKSKFYKKYEIKDFLRIDYSNEKLLSEAKECNPNRTISRKRIWDENPQIVLKGNKINDEFDIIRTITTKQDRHPNSGNLYFNSHEKGKSKFRYLTPRECFLFMGFTDKDYDNIIKNNTDFHANRKMFPRDKLIRMAGNSIPVKLLEGMFWQIKQLDEIITEK